MRGSISESMMSSISYLNSISITILFFNVYILLPSVYIKQNVIFFLSEQDEPKQPLITTLKSDKLVKTSPLSHSSSSSSLEK